MLNISTNQNITGVGEEISSSMFGSIYTTFTTLKNFMNQGKEYQVGGIRWPGGSLAEGKTSGSISYDLLLDDIYHHADKPNINKGLSYMLELAHCLDRPFSMVIPTLPQFNQGLDASGSERFDILQTSSDIFFEFLTRLTTEDGYYDSALEFKNSQNPIILEIGNETAQLGWDGGTFDGTWNYAEIAAPLLSAAARFYLDAQPLNIEIAVQMGNNSGGAYRIIDELSSLQQSYSQNLFDQIDSLVSHNMLVFAAEDFDVTQESQIINLWASAFENYSSKKLGEDVYLYASAWSVGDHRFGHNIFKDTQTLEIVDQAYFNDSSRFVEFMSFVNDLGGNDVGARQASGTADVFVKMVALGYEAASLWGTVDPSNHTNSYQSFWNDSLWSQGDAGETAPLNHGGEVLAMLADSLQGYTLELGGSIAENAQGDLIWNASYFDPLSETGAGDVNTYVFSGGTNGSLLASVTDIDGYLSTYTGSLDYDVEIPNGTDQLEIQVIGTEFLTNQWRQFRDNIDNDWLLGQLSSSEITEFRRLFEVPVVESYVVDVSQMNYFTHTFASDFETVMFTFIDNDNAGLIASPISASPESISITCWEWGRNNELRLMAPDSEKADRTVDEFVWSHALTAKQLDANDIRLIEEKLFIEAFPTDYFVSHDDHEGDLAIPLSTYLSHNDIDSHETLFI